MKFKKFIIIKNIKFYIGYYISKVKMENTSNNSIIKAKSKGKLKNPQNINQLFSK